MKTIEGRFVKQRWNHDQAEVIGEETFDATRRILAMTVLEIRNMRDCTEPTDWLGQSYVEDAICEFFGVEKLKNITRAMLAAKKKEYANVPRRTHWVEVKRKSTQVRCIQVEARDAEEAKEIAMDTAPDEDFTGTEKDVDYEVVEVYICE